MKVIKNIKFTKNGLKVKPEEKHCTCQKRYLLIGKEFGIHCSNCGKPTPLSPVSEGWDANYWESYGNQLNDLEGSLGDDMHKYISDLLDSQKAQYREKLEHVDGYKDAGSGVTLISLDDVLEVLQ